MCTAPTTRRWDAPYRRSQERSASRAWSIPPRCRLRQWTKTVELTQAHVSIWRVRGTLVGDRYRQPDQAPEGTALTITDVLADHPNRDTFDAAELQRAIEACRSCATACELCVDFDLATDPAGMANCIRTCMDCATICAATAAVLSRPTPSGEAWRALVEACITACRECGEECADHDHACCKACASSCRECAEALEQLLTVAD